jgi:hypothetical protein
METNIKSRLHIILGKRRITFASDVVYEPFMIQIIPSSKEKLQSCNSLKIYTNHGCKHGKVDSF